MQLRHLTASIVVLTAGAVARGGGSKADSNAARSGGSAAPAASKVTVRRCADVTDNARAAGRSIA